MLRDLRIAVRSLRSWRWGAILAVLTLAIGIGTTTALYSLLRVALADSAVEIEEVDRLVRIYGVNPPLGARRSPVTLDDFETLLGTHSFEAVAAYDGLEMTVGRDDDVVNVMRVSPRFFDVMRGRAIDGRLFTAADRGHDAPTAVVSELTWRRRFAGRRINEALSIRLNGREHAVVGVLPPSFSYSILGMTADVWIPLARPVADGERVGVIARLGPGVSWEAAAGELSTLTPPNQPEAGWRWGGIPVQQDVRARTGGATAWIFLPAGVVLIIGCVNVACMLLARGIRRDTELSVRMALGAGRGAIFRQLLLENVLLGAAAGRLGDLRRRAAAARSARRRRTGGECCGRPWRVLRTVLSREMKLIAAALATGTIGTVAMTRSSGFDDAAMIVASGVGSRLDRFLRSRCSRRVSAGDLADRDAGSLGGPATSVKKVRLSKTVYALRSVERQPRLWEIVRL